MTAEEILNSIYNINYKSNYSTNYPKQCIIEAMNEYYNQAVRDIRAEYETNKEFNVTSILKYLK